jgi:hypothetical protein
MDLETSQLLRRLTELTEENNKILLKIQKHTRWTMFFNAVKWILIIGVFIGSYIVVQPYIDQVMSMYKTLQATQTQSVGLQDYLKSIQDSMKYGLPK